MATHGDDGARKYVPSIVLKASGLCHRTLGHRAPAVERAPNPGRFSSVRNVVTPMGSALWGSRPTARKAELPSGNGMTQEANAGGRKATGNRPDRANSPRRKPADVGLVNHPKYGVTGANRGKS